MRLLSALALTVATVLGISIASCETDGVPEPAPGPGVDGGTAQGTHRDAISSFPDGQYDGGSINQMDAF